MKKFTQKQSSWARSRASGR